MWKRDSILCALVCVTLLIGTGGSAGRAESSGDRAVDMLFPERDGQQEAPADDKIERALQLLDEALDSIENRLRQFEARLGHSTRPPTMTHNVERRLADIERRLDRIEQQLNRMQQLDQRVRRLEAQRQ